MKTRSLRLVRLVTLLGLAVWAVWPRATAQTPGRVAIACEGSLVSLSWDCVPGRQYQLLVTADLGSPWLEVATEPKPLVATSNRLSYTLGLLPETQLYRVAELADTNSFQIEVRTTSSPENFVVNFDSPDALMVVWGDGNTNTYIYSGRATQTHTYSTAGTYTITMSGHAHGIDFFIYPDPGTGTPELITAVKTPIRGITGINTALEMFKHGHNIPSFPQGLFDNCPSITTFYDVFIQCLKVTSFPSNLFASQTNVTSFYAVFDQCEKLTNIQANVFSGHTNVTLASWAFAKCYALKSIPAGIYDPFAKNRSFEYVHYRNFALTNIPPLLFNRNTNVTSYASAFYQCSGLTGHTPTNSAGLKLWELSPAPTGTGCFSGCTNLSDYASIPAGWK